MNARACSAYAAFTWSKVTTRNPGSSASGEFESDTVSGPNGSSHKPLPPGGVGHAIRPLSPLPRRLLVDLPRQALQKRVFNHLLIKLGILSPPVLARIVDKELALRNAGRPKGVGLNDVRPGLQKPAMNVADHLRLCQRKQVAVVQQVFLRVLEAFPANVRLFHPVGADGRAHRSIDDGDAAFKDLSQRMKVRLSHFFPMVYGLLFQHIGVVDLSEPIRAELRPTGLDGRNPHLNGDASPDS